MDNDKNLGFFQESVKIDVGTLSVVLIIVVTSCSILMLIVLYCWNRVSSHQRLHCNRCHQPIGIHGLPLPPQNIPPVLPVVQNHTRHSRTNYPYQHQPQSYNSHSNTEYTGRKVYQQVTQAKELPVPTIIVRKSEPVNYGESATFQRLGMKKRDSEVDSKALETKSLAQMQESPPAEATPGLEPLTPTPFVLSKKVQQNSGKVVQNESNLKNQKLLSTRNEPRDCKLQQVKMVNFPSTIPCAVTPTNASSKRTSFKGRRSVQAFEPTPINRSFKGNSSQQKLLEVSEMYGTEITTGDLANLCDGTEETSFMNSKDVDGAKYIINASENSNKFVKTSSSFGENATGASRMVLGPAVLQRQNPSLVSQSSTLTPNNHYAITGSTEGNKSEARSKCNEYDASNSISHHDYVRKDTPIASFTNAILYNYRKQSDSNSKVGPAAISKFSFKNVSYRKSHSDTDLVIENNDKFITNRKNLNVHGNTMPASAVIDQFESERPSQSVLGVDRSHQNLRTSNAAVDPNARNLPSRIPINEGYLNQVDKPAVLTPVDKCHVELKDNGFQKKRNVVSFLNDKSVGDDKILKGRVDSSTRTLAGKSSTLSIRTPVQNLKLRRPGSSLDSSTNSNKFTTPAQEKTITGSGSKLPPSYPGRPKTDRKTVANSGTYTKSKATTPIQ